MKLDQLSNQSFLVQFDENCYYADNFWFQFGQLLTNQLNVQK